MCIKIEESNFLFFGKQGYSNFFEYLTILLGICNPLIPHTLDYYRKESYEGDPKILARGFESSIS